MISDKKEDAFSILSEIIPLKNNELKNENNFKESQRNEKTPYYVMEKDV